jgi:hypothetical protein
MYINIGVLFLATLFYLISKLHKICKNRNQHDGNILFKNRLNLKILKSKIIEKNDIPIDYTCPLHGINLSSCYESIFLHKYDGDPEMLKGNVCFYEERDELCYSYKKKSKLFSEV